MNGTDEEIDTAEIEKDWIEIQCCIKAHKRMNEMETGDENRIPEERWVAKAAGWNPEFIHEIQNLESCGKTKKKMGR